MAAPRSSEPPVCARRDVARCPRQLFFLPVSGAWRSDQTRIAELARHVLLSERIADEAQVSRPQRQAHAMLPDAAVALHDVGVVEPEAVGAGAEPEGRAVERVVRRRGEVEPVSGAQRQVILPAPLDPGPHVGVVRVRHVDVERHAQAGLLVVVAQPETEVGREPPLLGAVGHHAADVLGREAEAQESRGAPRRRRRTSAPSRA